MARAAVADNHRLQLRATPVQRARIARAAALQQMDLTQFVTGAALREAETVIAEAAAVHVSGRDFARIQELLEHPPAPSARLLAAIAALPDTV
ncbi:MAG: DUF1778 domain-containing protein [Thermomicrobiales bacterium]